MEQRNVQVKISVPKGLVEFLRDLSRLGGSEINPKAWIEKEIVEAARATIDTFSDDEYLVAARVKEKYGLLEEKEVN